jgi:hypothetical protein
MDLRLTAMIARLPALFFIMLEVIYEYISKTYENI